MVIMFGQGFDSPQLHEFKPLIIRGFFVPGLFKRSFMEDKTNFQISFEELAIRGK